MFDDKLEQESGKEIDHVKQNQSLLVTCIQYPKKSKR